MVCTEPFIKSLPVLVALHIDSIHVTARCAYVSLRVAVALNPKNVRMRGGKGSMTFHKQDDTGGKRAPGC